MSLEATEQSPFAAAAFFARAKHALDAEGAALPVGGDHILNPDLPDVDHPYRDAAVLIPVVAHADAATVILTERTGHLSAHAGQIAFPGGKIDAEDADPTAAALREAGEEIGLDRAALTVIGSLAPYLSRTGYRIVPVLARVEPGYTVRPNRNEVADIFEVPLAFLMTPANHKRGTRVFMGRERYFYEMPYEGRYIWGVTAGIIRGLYEQVYG
jgi:8-oxo-dGTP pyrophosphatase MutT (NUDIX family)